MAHGASTYRFFGMGRELWLMLTNKTYFYYFFKNFIFHVHSILLIHDIKR